MTPRAAPIAAVAADEQRMMSALPSRAELARRWPRLRVNRLTFKWVDDESSAKGDDLASLLAFLKKTPPRRRRACARLSSADHVRRPA